MRHVLIMAIFEEHVGAQSQGKNASSSWKFSTMTDGLISKQMFQVVECFSIEKFDIKCVYPNIKQHCTSLVKNIVLVSIHSLSYHIVVFPYELVFFFFNFKFVCVGAVDDRRMIQYYMVALNWLAKHVRESKHSLSELYN